MLNEKKERYIIFALAGILLLIICIPVKGKQANGKVDLDKTINNSSYDTEAQVLQQAGGEQEVRSDSADAYRETLERELEELLGGMEGVGRVKVMITLSSTGEEIVEKDRPTNHSNLTENDGSGGSRSTGELGSEESTVFITDKDGRQIPYVRKTLRPDIEGVAVIAQGGGNEMVRKNISESIQALFGLNANKIKIAKMKTTK